MSALTQSPWWVATGLLRGGLARRGRLVFTAAVGVAVALLALAGNLSDGGRGDIGGILIDAGLMFFVPVATLTFASACLGDLVEDSTLVYLWLRPVARWQIAVAALLAAMEVALPITALTLVAAAIAGSYPGMLPSLLLAGVLGTVAYGALFVALGLRTQRSLVWGLGYIVIWEGLLSSIAAPFARLSLRRYVVTLFTDNAPRGVTSRAFETSTPHALIVLVAVTVAAVLLTARFLRRDVD